MRLNKKALTDSVRPRYLEANKETKSMILNEFCKNTQYHRKHAIAKLNQTKQKKPKKKPGRPSMYNQETIIAPLRKIWLATDLSCSKRLKEAIPEWLPHMEYKVSRDVKKALLRISPATIDRILQPYRLGKKRRHFSTTKPGGLLKNKIPIKNNQWDEKQPGFLEADTVAHCGTTLLGEFVYTLDVVDIATGWSEQRALWTKSKHQVVSQIQDIEKTLPFKILGFDSDNGTEFLNSLLLEYFTHRPDEARVAFTRSRPYHKDDNAHIEQKNWTHVRQWLGYYRFDNPDVRALINDLYKNEWRLYHNFFQPSTKLVSKIRVGSTIVKKHDKPKTPYKRLIESKFIDSETKNMLKAQYKTLNPFELKKAIEKRLKPIFQNARLKPCQAILR